MFQADLPGPFAAFVFVVGVVIVYWVGTLLIDHYYKRKAEFVDDIQEKMEKSKDAKGK